MPPAILKFPNKFYWGTATAAFQIEGHPEEYLAKLSDWSEWIDREDKVQRPTNQGRAVDHYEHMIEDVSLIKGLNNNSYRFSFNWARLHRGPNEFDLNTVQFYSSLLDQLKASSIEPFATIVHFVLPKWLSKEGGWENPRTAYAFEEFTKFLLKHFGSRIKFWITHNEPNIFLGFGYESGIWPPGYQNEWGRYFQAYQGLLLGHQLAYKAIKEYNSKHQVGFAQNLYHFQAYEAAKQSSNQALPLWQTSDSVPTIIRNQLHNLMFVESCVEMNALDFLGVNYYTRFSYKFNPQAKDSANPALEAALWGELADPIKDLNSSTNSLGWELYPQGLYQALTNKRLRSLLEGRPVYITENGYSHVEKNSVSDIEDAYRIKFIQQHLLAVHQAINAGVDVRGYFYWSLLDNFEWALGMAPRFGLVHVDHESFQRKPKKSYHFYSEIAMNNGLATTTACYNSDHGNQHFDSSSGIHSES